MLPDRAIQGGPGQPTGDQSVVSVSARPYPCFRYNILLIESTVRPKINKPNCEQYILIAAIRLAGYPLIGKIIIDILCIVPKHNDMQGVKD